MVPAPLQAGKAILSLPGRAVETRYVRTEKDAIISLVKRVMGEMSTFSKPKGAAVSEGNSLF